MTPDEQLQDGPSAQPAEEPTVAASEDVPAVDGGAADDGPAVSADAPADRAGRRGGRRGGERRCPGRSAGR